MAGPSGRRFSWALSDAAAFERYESGLEHYHGPHRTDAPVPGLAGKLHGLIRIARDQQDHTIATALSDILAGLQRRVQPIAPPAGTAIANDP